MTHVLEAYDLVTYSYTQGQPEWEQDVQKKLDSVSKNHTWDLFPWPQGNNFVKCRWVYWTKFTFEGIV
jgi:hypothetical protein